MIADALKELARLAVAAGRPAQLKLNHRDFIFNDAKNEYVEQSRSVYQTGTVARVECLAAIVLEEARRRAERSSGGDWMTVTFKDAGAVFSADDRERLDTFYYVRQLSDEWTKLREAQGKRFKHEAWIRLLQELASVTLDGRDVVRAFRKLDVTKGTRVVSSPTLQDGESGSAYEVNLAVQTAGGEVPTSRTMPSDLKFHLPFARGGQALWWLDAEVDAQLVKDEKDREVLEFRLFIPELARTEMLAVEAEVAWFREATKSLPHLLVLENF